MRIDILTLFPEMFCGALDHSIIGKAVQRGIVDIRTRNFREHAHDRHRTVDDYPYGGGPGMVLRPEPLFEAVEAVNAELDRDWTDSRPRQEVVLLTPQGAPFTQGVAVEFSQLDHLVLICGRYEGVDERVHQHLVTREVSIGDYVLSGGEPAALVVVDAVVRLLPGVLGSAESAHSDSFAEGAGGILQFPQYTRPADYRGWTVPAVLLSGNHEEIARWRREQSQARTRERRPDLLSRAGHSPFEPAHLGE